MNKHTRLNNLHHGNFPKYVVYNSLLNIVFTKECVNYKADEVLVYTLIFRVLIYYLKFIVFGLMYLSSELGARQAQREVVKIFFFDFSYWA